jgi:hypothetical protein
MIATTSRRATLAGGVASVPNDKLIDSLDEQISFARGIEAAIRGLEVLDQGEREGSVSCSMSMSVAWRRCAIASNG